MYDTAMEYARCRTASSAAGRKEKDAEGKPPETAGHKAKGTKVSISEMLC